MMVLVVEVKVISDYGAELWREIDTEPEKYKIYEIHHARIKELKATTGNIVDALAVFNQIIQGLVMEAKSYWM